MSLPRYPKYKASGVEWLGKVPDHWGAGSVRWLTRRYSGGTPDKTNLSYWEEGTIPWLNSGAVNDRLIKEPSRLITVEAFENSSAKWIPEGALLMALAGQGKTKGMVAQSAICTTCNQSMAAIVCGAEIKPRFLFWWLDSNYENIRNLAGGDLRDGLNLELLGNIRCPLPTSREQSEIASFLDRETAKIDELVVEQQRLIELLKEKRQAVISHAVTKGLNPCSPMKHSGIEWLGEVPDEWHICKLKSVASVARGTGYQNVEETTSGVGSVQMIRISDFNSFEPVWVKHSISLDNFKVRTSDILIAGTGASAGITMLVTSDMEGMIHSYNAPRIRCSDVVPQFLFLVLNSQLIQDQEDLLFSGSAQHFLDLDSIARLQFPCCTEAEQWQIIQYVDRSLNELALLGGEVQRAIDLLQERRAALISAAVTGKIDVRELVATEAA